MRTTVRLDDALMEELKEFARQEGISLAQLFNKTVRAGLTAIQRGEPDSKKRYREKTYEMGEPLVDLTKAMQLALELEEEATIEKMRERG